MQIVTQSLRLARQRKPIPPEIARWYKTFTHRRQRRAVKVWLTTGRWVRNIDRPLTGRYLN
jgi:hypothetical protein